MIVMGLDLSLARTGWAHILYEDGRILAHGVIEPKAAWPYDQRRCYIVDQVARYVGDSVSNIVIEEPIVHRNRVTAMRLNQLYGAVLDRLRNGPPVLPCNVQELKAWAVVGGATKEQMQQAAHTRYGRWMSADEADAALLAGWGREQVMAAIAEHPAGGA